VATAATLMGSGTYRGLRLFEMSGVELTKHFKDAKTWTR
jgi:hypothetical protein